MFYPLNYRAAVLFYRGRPSNANELQFDARADGDVLSVDPLGANRAYELYYLFSFLFAVNVPVLGFVVVKQLFLFKKPRYFFFSGFF